MPHPGHDEIIDGNSGGRFCRGCGNQLYTEDLYCGSCHPDNQKIGTIDFVEDPLLVRLRERNDGLGYINELPDDSYPIRILEAFKRRCDLIVEDKDNPIFDLNKINKSRSLILERAIKAISTAFFSSGKDAKKAKKNE